MMPKWSERYFVTIKTSNAKTFSYQNKYIVVIIEDDIVTPENNCGIFSYTYILSNINKIDKILKPNNGRILLINYINIRLVIIMNFLFPEKKLKPST